MEDHEVATAAGPSGGKVSSLSGLWQVFVGPTAFFERLRKDPKVLVPWVVIGVICFLFFWFNADMFVEFQKQVMAERNPEQAAQIPDIALKISIVGGGLLMMLLGPLLTAALAFFWGNVVFAGKAKFKQILSVTLYAAVVFALGFLVLWPMMAAKHSMAVSLSLAVFAVEQPIQSFTYVALSKIGLFYIWEFVVASIGYAVIYGFPKSKGYLISLLSLGLISILHVLSTLLQP